MFKHLVTRILDALDRGLELRGRSVQRLPGSKAPSMARGSGVFVWDWDWRVKELSAIEADAGERRPLA